MLLYSIKTGKNSICTLWMHSYNICKGTCVYNMYAVRDGSYMPLYVWDQKKISCWGLPSTFLGTEPHLCICHTGLWASRDSIVSTSCLTIGTLGYELLYPALHIVWGAKHRCSRWRGKHFTHWDFPQDAFFRNIFWSSVVCRGGRTPMDREGGVLRLINSLSLGWMCESLVQYFSLGVELHSRDSDVVLGVCKLLHESQIRLFIEK